MSQEVLRRAGKLGVFVARLAFAECFSHSLPALHVVAQLASLAVCARLSTCTVFLGKQSYLVLPPGSVTLLGNLFGFKLARPAELACCRQSDGWSFDGAGH